MIIEIRQQLNSTESHSKNIVLNRVITYILDALSAEDWLYKIRKEITNEQEKCFVFITFRFFGIEEIEKYKVEMAKIYKEVFKADDFSANFLITRIDDSLKNNIKIVGAFENEKLIGFVYGFDFLKENWWAMQVDSQLPSGIDWYKGTFELNELAVIEKYQGRGYGKKLMKCLIENFEGDKILLSTKKFNNDKIINFYHKLGFKDLVNPFEYPNGDYETSIILCLNK